MRNMIKYLILGLVAMIVVTFILGLSDDAFVRTGIWYRDVVGAVRYYILWVLPYWWVIILLGSIALAFISYIVKTSLSKIL